MIKYIAPLLLTLTLAPTASAQEQRSGLSRVLLYGMSPGSPSTGKVATILTLHAATLSAWVGGTYVIIDYASEADKHNADRDRGCSSFAECNAQDARRAELSDKQALGAGLIAGGTLTLLGSVAAAFLWDNDRVDVGVTPTGAWARIQF